MKPNRKNATKALAGKLPRLGKGKAREVFGPVDGWVYKVERPDGIEYGGNEGEHRLASYLRNSPAWDNTGPVYIPETHLFHLKEYGTEAQKVVLAMEYIPGGTDEYGPWDETLADHGFIDCHAGNYIARDDGVICLIDLGYDSDRWNYKTELQQRVSQTY